MSELIVVLMILLLVFGASRLPQLGESLGKTMRNLKRGMASDDTIVVRKDETATPSDKAAPASKGSDPEDAELIDRKS